MTKKKEGIIKLENINPIKKRLVRFESKYTHIYVCVYIIEREREKIILKGEKMQT